MATNPWNNWYILDEQGNPVIETDIRVCEQFFSDMNKRRVAERTFTGSFGKIWVSTVFLGIPHPSGQLGDERPMFFETMVFAEDNVLQCLIALSEQDERGVLAQFFGSAEIQRRYATRDEALKGHEQMCRFVGTCVSKGLLS